MTGLAALTLMDNRLLRATVMAANFTTIVVIGIISITSITFCNPPTFMAHQCRRKTPAIEKK